MKVKTFFYNCKFLEIVFAIEYRTKYLNSLRMLVFRTMKKKIKTLSTPNFLHFEYKITFILILLIVAMQKKKK